MTSPLPHAASSAASAAATAPLRIAVPNKGSLSEPAAQLLREAGYATRREGRELVLADPENGAEFFFLRPRDIAVYVGSGTLDVGITGRDLLLDSRAEAEEVMQLGFGASTFRFAGPASQVAGGLDVAGLQGQRVATSYPGLVADHLAAAGVSASVVRLDGAVETAVQLGVADAIADVVETGSTLRSAGLAVFGEPILRSEAVVITRRSIEAGGGPVRPAGLDVLLRRIQGVLVARQYVMVDYDVPREHLDAACALTPGLESPTVAPLADPAWAAVRAMVPRATTNRVMDELYDLGARAILVTTIHACRL
ncbi:ATP phosphoribosyltransferase (homohexameric) [Quadrisphaera granulorum]|uniref:ATP phosphoribosyltransferase n=1 Tax=Quadrisphaera granulorum TaxID=317664 RepID=A0A316A2I4_9ACTN|nr:ATP phosphoribosyltransferase (homohexameric) [Quadrisphaera granulorum]SZE97830.1 ATP phosphoribosyltransferase (homohexameric) [Quadrisphaera granulorum]